MGFGIGVASAQSLRNADQPAEFPPSSYTGKQYVDSKGCVFVRAGFDGAVTWVPRVSRKRTVLCGFEPTFAGNAAPEPRVVEAPRVVEPPARAPAAAPASVIRQAPPRQTVAAVAPAPAPAPRVVYAAPAPARVAVTPPAPPPVRTVSVQPAPPVAAAPAVPAATACPGASVQSQRFLVRGNYRVRCAPQGEFPSGAAMPETAAVAVKPAPKIAPPPGYRAAFSDDRFNPNRGIQTAEGAAQMRLIWTNGVPRRLVDRNTGRDMTRHFPKLRFPFTSIAQQNAYVADRDPPATPPVSPPDIAVAAKNIPPTALLANAPAPERATAVAVGHRYVQVATFSVLANAQNTAARLKAMGLPVRVGTYQKRGKSYRIVLAGPFGDASQLLAGLNAARRAGYPDAFTRK